MKAKRQPDWRLDRAVTSPDRTLGIGKEREMNTERENENIGHHGLDGPSSGSPGAVLSDEEMQVWKLEGFDDLPLTMSVPVVGKHLGVSKSTAYSMCKAGTIRARRFGSRMSVTRHELFRLLHGPESPASAAQW